jgi:FMN phosphatase YigB (HAD superfamily)
MGEDSHPFSKSMSPGLPIKAIAWDLGGVLFTERKSIAVVKLERDYHYDWELVTSFLLSPQSKDLPKGLIADGEFWAWAQDKLPERYDAATIRKVWYESYILDNDVLALIKKLKGQYKLVAFSDNIKSRIELLDQKYDFRRLFDQQVYSFDFHCIKPHKKFIGKMIQVSECSPSEIVYVDDNADCAPPAEGLGVNFILYSRQDIRHLQRELNKLGVRLQRAALVSTVETDCGTMGCFYSKAETVEQWTNRGKLAVRMLQFACCESSLPCPRKQLS